MLFWLLAVLTTAIACAALYFAATPRSAGAAAGTGMDATTAHYRLQLKEIEADITNGRLTEADAQAARAEMAREVLRLKGEADKAAPGPSGAERVMLPASLLLVAAIAFGLYWVEGNPGLPSQPLDGRTRPVADMTLQEAVQRIEAQLSKTPDDVRGWAVIAPVYLQLGRYDDAVNALRHVNELQAPTADSQTDLAEALMLAKGGELDGEPLALLQNAAKLDPTHVRSRYYLASDMMRRGDYAAAIPAWQHLIGMAKGDEAWLDTARQGLALAQAGGVAPTEAPAQQSADESAMIGAMVSGLAARLDAEGGPLEDWTRLVRSYLVLGDAAAAQKAYDAARAAYPAAAARADLDKLAADGGLH